MTARWMANVTAAVFIALWMPDRGFAQEASSTSASAQSARDDRTEWRLTIAGLAAAGAANLWIHVDSCRWCDRNAEGKDTLNGFDRSARSAFRWSDPDLHTADVLSYVTEYAPLSLLLIHREDGISTRALSALEALAVTNLITEGVKVAAARERPYVHFATPDSGASDARDANASFVSGHASGAVTLVAAMVRTCRLEHCSYEKPLWLIGGPLALSTMWLRMGADKHYMTDVLAGAGLGAVVGWWMPGRHGHGTRQPTILPTVSLHTAALSLEYHW